MTHEGVQLGIRLNQAHIVPHWHVQRKFKIRLGPTTTKFLREGKVKYGQLPNLRAELSLFSACSKCKISVDAEYATVHSQCILTIHIKVNLFHVTWLTVMFFMPRARFICSAVYC